MRISEKNLPRLLFGGMLILVLLITAALAAYYTLQHLKLSDQQISKAASEAKQQQKAVLQAEIDAIHDFVAFTRARTENVLKAEIKSQTDQAYQIAEAIWNKEKNHRPEKEIRQLIIEALRPVRFFEGRGYIFIDDLQGNCLLLPTAPQREGSSLWDNRDDTGHYIMRGLIEATNTPEAAGFSRYRWYAPDSPREMREKIAYTRQFKPFNWVIGTGEYIYKVEDDLKRVALERIKARHFGKDGYISVAHKLADGDTELTANPTSSNIGLRLSSLPPSSAEKELLQRIVNTAETGGGFLEYAWKHPSEPGMKRKLSLISTVNEWGWILTAGIYLDDLDAVINEHQLATEEVAWENAQGTLLIGLIALLSALCFAMFYARWMGKLFHNYQQDIERQHRELLDLAQQQKLAARVFESGQEAIFITDASGRIIDANASFEILTGFSRAETIGQTPKFLASGRHDSDFYTAMYATLQATGNWSGEVWNRRKDGSIFPEWQTISAVHNAQGEVTHYISSFTDISERKHAEARLRHMADYDALTGLPNRRLLSERATQVIASVQRAKQRMAIMFLDLDHFKNINDSLGHAAGDLLLTSIAERLRSSVRAEDTVSRIGGDEFIILLAEIENPEDAGHVAKKLLASLRRPLELANRQIEVTSSLGIAIYPEDGADVGSLLKNADTAMYHAKEQGRNNFQFFTAELNARTEARFAKEVALRRALEQGELRLHYQPQIALKSDRIVGCEALVRWQHPEQGLLAPGHFIELAEECGLIENIGNWVLNEACRQGAAWLAAGLPIKRIGVNVSPFQLRKADFIDVVSQALAAHDFPANSLELEITESMLVDHSEHLAELFNQLQDLGVQIALDDFGTGYSNLSYLKRFPLNRLKIDRSFVSDIPHDALDATLTMAVIGLADNFGLGVIAEGVETEEQLEFLRGLDCDEVQGFLFHQPMPGEQMTRLLSEQLETR
jgi:diguanylate cyclase (GGDEF)-like protein/PAS domain S-box-containing protein